jgi:hypothetical protein
VNLGVKFGILKMSLMDFTVAKNQNIQNITILQDGANFLSNFLSVNFLYFPDFSINVGF